MKEIWKDITGFPGYAVSNHGRIRSNKTAGRYSTIIPASRLRKTYLDREGYEMVNLRKDGKPRTCKVHRIVLEAFVGPCPEEMEACHTNGRPRDNRLTNLRWGTKQSNLKDKIDHGRIPRGSSHPRARYSDAQISRVRQLGNQGNRAGEIANITGISIHHVRKVIAGRTRAVSEVSS